jgi:phage recombination protein Bet
MNAITPTTPAATEEDVLRVLENSLYPGAKPESIRLVLAYCRVNGLDPMLKPVHIVPTSVKVGYDKWETRDVLMPGIADYRIKASRSGDYVGKSEPFFGPDVTENLAGTEITYPLWCKITVQRFVRGAVRDFTAVEYWLENYATTGKTDAPNKMWRKRAYGQLAKCAEAQALRMAFPEFSGGIPTAEEMEGKFDGPTLEHEKPPATLTHEPQLGQQLGGSRREQINREVPMDRQRAAAADTQRSARQVAATVYDTAWLAPLDEQDPAVWIVNLEKVLAACKSQTEVTEAGGHVSVRNAVAKAPTDIRRRVSELLATHFARMAPPAEQQEGDGWPSSEEATTEATA